MLHTQRVFHNVVKNKLGQTQSDLSTMGYQQLCLSFLKSGSQSLVSIGDLFTSNIPAMCLIFPRYDALFSLEQFPLFPQENGNSDICTRLQIRAEVVAWTTCLVPQTQSQMITAWMHGTLDLPPRYRGVNLGKQHKLSESTMCQICGTHRAWMSGEPGMTRCHSLTRASNSKPW